MKAPKDGYWSLSGIEEGRDGYESLIKTYMKMYFIHMGWVSNFNVRF